MSIASSRKDHFGQRKCDFDGGVGLPGGIQWHPLIQDCGLGLTPVSSKSCSWGEIKKKSCSFWNNFFEVEQFFRNFYASKFPIKKYFGFVPPFSPQKAAMVGPVLFWPELVSLGGTGTFPWRGASQLRDSGSWTTSFVRMSHQRSGVMRKVRCQNTNRRAKLSGHVVSWWSLASIFIPWKQSAIQMRFETNGSLCCHPYALTCQNLRPLIQIASSKAQNQLVSPSIFFVQLVHKLPEAAAYSWSLKLVAMKETN